METAIAVVEFDVCEPLGTEIKKSYALSCTRYLLVFC